MITADDVAQAEAEFNGAMLRQHDAEDNVREVRERFRKVLQRVDATDKALQQAHREVKIAAAWLSFVRGRVGK